MATSPTADLFKAATSARKNSHSPYSGHAVGAAVLTRSGKIYGSCNMENASYGGSVCAERGAIQKAISEEGTTEIREILVVTDVKGAPWPPCGFCRQVIAEFAPAGASLPIYLANLDGVQETLAFEDLLPRAFTPRHLD